MPEAQDFSFLKPGAHIHLMGVCGTAMASLAGLLKDSGYKVTGSDEQAYPPMSTQLESLGIGIMKGYKKENLSPKPDLVIVGNVIRRDMEETLALLESDIPYTSLPKALSEFVIRDRQSIVISGTHGKTTTTSMAAWCLGAMGLDPGYLVGGIPVNMARSFSCGSAPYFVIEGDEYDTAFFDKVPKFILYKPRHVILTSIEFDHADIYGSIEDIKKAFSSLLRLIPADGTFLYCMGDANIESILPHLNPQVKVASFGLSKDSDYQAVDIRRDGLRTDFRVNYKGQNIGEFELNLIADYNLLNALGVIALGHRLSWSLEKLRGALAQFKGVKRRQEVLGEPDGVLVIEDFAHHPTAVANTITAVKEAFRDRKLFSIFEPRSATSRRKVFQTAYTEAFKRSDVAFISEPYDQSRIAENDRFSTVEIIRELEQSGTEAKSFTQVDEIVEAIKNQARTGDIVLIMSNGGFGGIYGQILNALNTRRTKEAQTPT